MKGRQDTHAVRQAQQARQPTSPAPDVSSLFATNPESQTRREESAGGLPNSREAARTIGSAVPIGRHLA